MAGEGARLCFSYTLNGIARVINAEVLREFRKYDAAHRVFSSRWENGEEGMGRGRPGIEAEGRAGFGQSAEGWSPPRVCYGTNGSECDVRSNEADELQRNQLGNHGGTRKRCAAS